jgi:two-component system, chemotaxis family, response regulator Rcp1
VEKAAPQQLIGILLVAQDTRDAWLTERLLQESGTPTAVHRARGWVQALAFLRRDGAYRETPRPDLIVLDMGSERHESGEFLASIKSEPELRDIPVVVLTETGPDILIAEVGNGLADGAIAKPLDAEKVANAVALVSRIEASLACVDETPLLADLAHELRTHLNPIIAFSEIMKLEIRGPLNSDYREYARGIHLSALALSRLVFDILNRSRSELRKPLRHASNGSVSESAAGAPPSPAIARPHQAAAPRAPKNAAASDHSAA